MFARLHIPRIASSELWKIAAAGLRKYEQEGKVQVDPTRVIDTGVEGITAAKVAELERNLAEMKK
jgi:hypothetical protein